MEAPSGATGLAVMVALSFSCCYRDFPTADQVCRHRSHLALASLTLRLSLTPSLTLEAILLSVSMHVVCIWINFALSPFLPVYTLFLVNL